MKNYANRLGWAALASIMMGSALCQTPRSFPGPPPVETLGSREEIEAFAATNKAFAPAIDYIIATLDGNQPQDLPEGVTPEEMSRVFREVFPKSAVLFDQPINFYGRVLDERNRPVSGAHVHFEWQGFLIHGRKIAEMASDPAGYFSLTNQFGTELNISVTKSDCYVAHRNSGAGSCRYASPFEASFKPDRQRPVVYYLRRKGVGAATLITSRQGYRDFSVEIPLDGSRTNVDLLQRKAGSGPLEISQIKPSRSNWKTATNWSFTMRLPTGGFMAEDEEFPYRPPRWGYRPVVKFNFEKGKTNWTTDIHKDYYIKFGRPPLYGQLRLETSILGSSAVLTYTINPDGSRNLEPKNEFTPPPPITKPAVVRTNAAFRRPLPLGGPTAKRPSSGGYRCVTIAGTQNVRGATDGTNGASLFNEPWGIATDKRGCIYVTEWGSSTIRELARIGTNWVVTTIVGTAGKEGSKDGTNSEARLNHPHGIVVDKEGSLYVADTFNHAVRQIRHIGDNWVATTIAGHVGVSGGADGTNTAAEFNNPGGITIDRKGNLYISDTGNEAIRKLTPVGSNWVVTTIAGVAGMIRDGRILRSAWGWQDGISSAARFFGPFGIAADSRDDLYVVDYSTSIVRKIRQDGSSWVVTTIAGLAQTSGYANGTNNASRFDAPRALAIDKKDNVYIDDTGTDTIRMISRVGTNYVVRTIAGLPWRRGYADGTNNAVQFNGASGIAVDSDCKIYLADTGNGVIRQITHFRRMQKPEVN